MIDDWWWWGPESNADADNDDRTDDGDCDAGWLCWWWWCWADDDGVDDNGVADADDADEDDDADDDDVYAAAGDDCNNGDGCEYCDVDSKNDDAERDDCSNGDDCNADGYDDDAAESDADDDYDYCDDACFFSIMLSTTMRLCRTQSSYAIGHKVYIHQQVKQMCKPFQMYGS